MKQALLAIALMAPALGAGAQDVNVPAFDAASIKVRTVPGGGPIQSSPDRYAQSNASLRDLILDAYHLQRYQIAGGPDWLGAVRFDVTAKASFVPSSEQMRLMVQRLLAERFAVRAHHETREMPIYVLRLARSDGRLGKQLHKTSVDCAAIEANRKQKGERAPLVPSGWDERPVCGSFKRAIPSPSVRGSMAVRYQSNGTTSGEFAAWLSPYVARMVVDRTGLVGQLDLDLTFGLGGGADSPSSNDDAVSIFTALQEQLGLKLDSARGPVDVLVIDRAELPSQN